jgi:hypothetical protein
MLEGEHLKSMICGECSPDTVGAVGRFAIPCALKQIHLASAVLEPVSAIEVQEEPRGIGHDYEAVRLLGHGSELCG